MKIYTKTGDDGTTMLFGGGRIPKHHLRIECYGTVDELNSYIGLLCSQKMDAKYKTLLKEIQDRLFSVGANLATHPEKEGKVQKPELEEADIELLEKSMDEIQEQLPPLKHFILPGGHNTVSFCHIARCVCRRTERLVVALSESEYVAPIILQYLNRLSDFLFVLARQLSYDLGVEELKWEPRKKDSERN